LELHDAEVVPGLGIPNGPSDQETLMSETAYCYHCGIHHPVEQMRQIVNNNGRRWRCIKSIEATKAGIAKRDAFGRQMTAFNKADAKAIRSRMPNPERNTDK